MSVRLIEDRRIQKSLQNLASMGLKVALEEIDSDTAMLVIDAESILDYIKRAVSSKLEYPKFYVELDMNERILVIYFWRGETPKWLVRKIWMKRES